MPDKKYNVLLDGEKIGTTALEKADAPMGVVFGVLNFESIQSGYNFFENYCKTNEIDATAYPENKLISTNEIPNLRVFDSVEKEIIGIACSISGMDSDLFEITILGISYPFYEEEFPHHVQAYHNQFGDE
ncbi:MAG: hypothetical protein P4L41_02010 [Flavipsychrobacter sp.]|nr:hypothetical protein [Flavipsychrobacter sp.]